MLTLNDYFNRHFVREFLERLRSKGRGSLLDLGCGSMPYNHLYDRTFSSVVSADIEVRHPEVDTIADVRHLPFSSETFDVVLFSEVLEHIDDDQRAISEISRVLRRDGHLILTVPFMYRMHETPHDYRRYTEFELDRLLMGSGLKTVLIRRRGGLHSLLLTIIGNLLYGVLTAMTRFPLIGFLFRPVRWLSEALLQAIFRVIAAASFGRSSLRPNWPGDRLTGIGGYLSAWTLGYCILAKKAGDG